MSGHTVGDMQIATTCGQNEKQVLVTLLSKTFVDFLIQLPAHWSTTQENIVLVLPRVLLRQANGFFLVNHLTNSRSCLLSHHYTLTRPWVVGPDSVTG